MGWVNWKIQMKVFVWFLLIFLTTLCGGLTDPRDVVAINLLYVSLGYPPLRGWLLVGGDPCGDSWEGVDCVFSNITSIVLNNRNLGGELGDILDFASILTIDLSNNHIGGTIPSTLPLTITNFYLSANQISGSIPNTFSSLTQLLDLSLSNNLLSGEIPDAFRQHTSLISLDFSGNKLSGQLPPSMHNLSSLYTLHLQDNQLSGTLDVLQDLPLNDLNIENNLFSGPIPAQLLSIPKFRSAGNPFNTSVIPSPPLAAAAPLSPAMAPYSEEGPRKHAYGPSLPEMPNSARAWSLLTAKRVLWTFVGVSLLILIAAGIWLYLSKCKKRRKMKEMVQRHNSHSHEMEKVPKEAVMKPLDGFGLDHRRTRFGQKKLNEREIDGTKVIGSSRYTKDHKIDMTGMDLNSMAMQLPTPLPPLLPVEKVTVNPVAPAELTMMRGPPKSINSTSSVRAFSIASLQQYTDSFSQENLIGEGILGSVYRAELPDGKLLAVKKLNARASRCQSDEEFLRLVSRISKLQHANIVELVGYCAEHGLRLFVYEYCQNGTLYDALQVDDEIHKKLSWSARMHIALGAARALEYLHEVYQPPIMHQNFKSANILLDDELAVHVSDCGLAPLMSSGSVSQLSGQLLTGYGYGAPEFESGSYTYQTDVYSFGVVMLEILTGRKSYDRTRPRGEQFLVRWAIPQLHDIDALSRMVDTSLNGAYPTKALSRFADIISRCLQQEPEFRPPMSEIVQDLAQMIQRETSAINQIRKLT